MFECIVQKANQSFTVTNGTVTGKITITRSTVVDGNLSVSFNDGPVRTVAFQDIDDNPQFGQDRYRLSLLLPLECAFEGMSPDIIENYLGRWTFTASPELEAPEDEDYRPTSYQDGTRIGLTPFDIDVRALVFNDIVGDFRDDIVDSNTGEVFSGGATYTAVAKMLPTPTPPEDAGHLDESEFVNLFYRARITAPGVGIVRTIEKEVTFDPAATEITIDWDGKDEFGRSVPGGLKYTLSFWGLLGSRALDSEDIQTGSGFIATVRNYFGPPDADRFEAFQINPNPWFPAPLEHDGRLIWVFNDLNEKYEALYFDENGEPWWPSELVFNTVTGEDELIYFFPEQVFDPISEEFVQVDEDFDGIPDVGPPEPTGISISGSVVRSGVDTSWRLHVRDPKTGIDLQEPFESDVKNSNVEVEWKYKDIINVLEANPGLNEVSYELHLGRCPTNEIELGISARKEENADPNDPCDVDCDTRIGALGEPRPILQVTASSLGDNGTPDIWGYVSRAYSFTLDFSRAIPQPIIEKSDENLDEVYNGEEIDIRLLSAPDQIEGDTVVVSASSALSGLSMNITLTRRQSGSGYFEAKNVDLTTILKDFTDPGNSGFDESQAFTVVTNSDKRGQAVDGGFEDNDVGRFVENLISKAKFQAGHSYRTAKSNLLNSSFPPKDTDEKLADHVEPNRTSLKAAGFESVSILHEDSTAEVRFRHRNQAPILYYSGVGQYTDNLVRVGDESFSPRIDLGVTDWAKVRTIFLVGCPNLDIHDYNSEHGSSKTIPDYSPGFEWDARRTLNGNLLGYNRTPSRDDETQRQIITAFFVFLDSGLFRAVDPTDLDEVALVWLAANIRFNQHTACAITRSGYYFVYKVASSRRDKRIEYEQNFMGHLSLRRAAASGLPEDLVRQIRRSAVLRRFIVTTITRTAYFIPRAVWAERETSILKQAHLRHARRFGDDLESIILTKDIGE